MPNAENTDAPHLQEINQEIYKRNLELAIVNKTLSLLRKLYQISLLALDPSSLSEKISETVRVDLNMEIVGVFLFDEKADVLRPLAFSKSQRLQRSIDKLGFIFKNYQISDVSKSKLKKIIVEKKAAMTNNLEDIWQGIIPYEKLAQVNEASHIKTVLLYPLLAGDRVIGALLLGLNRDYKVLSIYEKDSIKSLIDVVAVALDKAQLYEKLAATNEQLKILDKARSEFITIASHQLRTPPATIKWYLAAIMSGDFGALDSNIKEQLVKVQTTNNALIATIDDLLNVSRIERGKMEFSFEDTDLQAITDLTVEELIPQAKAKNLELIYEKPKSKLPPLVADKEKLRQVINNLIDNAIKYTKSGHVKVEIGMDDENYFCKVSDSGRGIASDQTAAIFEKFDRGKTAPKNSTGLGLGLYVGKVILEQHNGKIWAESPGEGQGSTFIFTIPIKNNLINTEYDLTKDQQTK